MEDALEKAAENQYQLVTIASGEVPHQASLFALADSHGSTQKDCRTLTMAIPTYFDSLGEL